jgi:hypothetical protein
VASDGTIYWPLANGGLARSTDKGATFVQVASPETLRSYNVLELPDSRLLSVGPTNVVVSSDRGITWRVLGPALPFEAPYMVAYSQGQNAVYVTAPDCGEVVPADAVARLALG